MGHGEDTITLTLTPAEARFLSWCVTWWRMSPDKVAYANNVLVAEELLRRLKQESERSER